jgi:HEAT repeat protein
MAVPEALTSVTVSGIVTHDSGDLTQHLDLTFRCRAAGGQACPSDGEFEDVRWHRIDALPELESYDPEHPEPGSEQHRAGRLYVLRPDRAIRTNRNRRPSSWHSQRIDLMLLLSGSIDKYCDPHHRP